jgi:hypothetical protein
MAQRMAIETRLHGFSDQHAVPTILVAFDHLALIPERAS